MQKIYGLTLDSIDINLPEIIDMLKSLPTRPYVRLVFDYPRPASHFKKAVEQIGLVANIIGQPSDSEYNAKMTVAQYKMRFWDYVANLPQVGIWEIINEANGDWLGKNAIRQAEVALQIVKDAGKFSLYTAYWNTETCKDSNGRWDLWHNNNLTAFLKSVTFATLSVYGCDCDGPEPTYAVLDAELKKLQKLFPLSVVGIGEFGKKGSASVLKHYMDYPRKGFGLYWYGRQDLVPKTKPLFKVFSQF